MPASLKKLLNKKIDLPPVPIGKGPEFIQALLFSFIVAALCVAIADKILEKVSPCDGAECLRSLILGVLFIPPATIALILPVCHLLLRLPRITKAINIVTFIMFCLLFGIWFEFIKL